MGSSFINFRGRGFWSTDDYIEDLASEVAAAINAAADGEEWLSQLASHWQLQSSGDFSGWIHLRLDEFLTSEERSKRLRALIQSVVGRYLLEHVVHRTGALMLRLLDGALTTDASSPLDYLIERRPIQPPQRNAGSR